MCRTLTSLVRSPPAKLFVVCSDLLGSLVIALVIIVIIVIILAVCSCSGCLRSILLLLLLSLDGAESLPLRGESIGLSLVIADNDVVEDGAALNLPEIEANEAEIGILVERIIILVLGVRNLPGLPDALVCGVGDTLGIPLTLVLRIVLHGRLPLAILLIVPVVGLLRLGIHNALLLNPVCRLGHLRVVNHGIIDPVNGLLVIGVGDLLWLQHLPVLLQRALIDLLLIDLNTDSVVR